MNELNEIRTIIRAEIHATAAEIRSLKRWWRTPPDRRPERPDTRFALLPLQRRATLLCMMMAHSRGRIHQRSSTLDEQAAQLGEAIGAMPHASTPLLDWALCTAGRAILARRNQLASNQPPGCVAPIVEHRA